MIEVDPVLIFALPLAVNLLLVFTWWIAYTVRDVARQAHARPTHIYRCAVCDRVYVDERDVPLARCPTCGCLNEATKR